MQAKEAQETVKPEITKEAAEAVYAIMGHEMAEEVSVYTIFTTPREYEARYKDLEEKGIALTDSFMGARGRELQHKVGVFLSPKAVGLKLVKGHARFNAGNLPRILGSLPRTKRTSRTLDGKLTNGLLIPIESWMDAMTIAEDAREAQDGATAA